MEANYSIEKVTAMKKCVEIMEYVGTMEDEESKEVRSLKLWIARTLDYTVRTYMQVNGPMSQDAFAEKAGIGWKSIDNILKRKHFPTLDTLNQIVVAADSNLAEFFSRMVTRMELASIEHEARGERSMIETLVLGMSNPKTRGIVQALSQHVGELLERSEVRS